MSSQRDSGAGHGSGVRRVRGLVRKEFIQILRDPSSLAIAFLLPTLLLFMFGYGVSLDAEDVPIAVVVDQPSAATSRLTGALRASRYFDPKPAGTVHAAQKAMQRGRVDGILHLRGDFSKDIFRSDGADILLIVDGVDANRARLVRGYLRGIYRKWTADEASVQGRQSIPSVTVEYRVWFNPEVRSRNFLVPGLIAVIMTLIGALLTALVVAREWERGTMESLFVTPVRMREILLGKLLPYFVLGMGGMALTVAMATWLFDVPFRGSWLALGGASALFLLVALGMGLLISTATKNQFVAGQIALLSTFLPAFILSGFIFNLQSTPAPIRMLSRIVAARYFIDILHTLFLAGTISTVLVTNAIALVTMAGLFLGLSRLLSRKRLD
ncbi:MAG: ABC transporter permease [Phycisphaerae bacterium]